MGAQHTPGPWSESAPDGSYHDVIRIFADADPEGALPVAICPQRQSAIMSVLSGQNDATTEAAANARLIAAAPELLEALEHAQTHIDHLATFARVDAKVKRKAADRERGTPYAIECLRNAEASDAEEARHKAVAELLRAAIAKARGA